MKFKQFQESVTFNYKETVVETPKEAPVCKPNTKVFEYRHDNSWLFPNISRGYKYMVGEHKYPKFSETMGLGQQMNKVRTLLNGPTLSGNFLKYNYFCPFAVISNLLTLMGKYFTL